MPSLSATCIAAESADTNMSVIVDSEAFSHIFNCGEATTRSMHQVKKGYRKLKAVFTTDVDTERASGLPGILMQSAEAHCTKLDVFGPLGLEHCIACHRGYMIRESLQVTPHEIGIDEDSSKTIHSDSALSVFAVPTHPQREDSLGGLNEAHIQKRKRDVALMEASLPHKKARLETGYPLREQSSQDTSPPDTISEDPSGLRRRVIRGMFPGSKKPSPITPTDRVERTKDWWKLVHTPLPPFKKEMPYTLSYILLGPQTRGKFDNAKAEALGLVGRECGPLKRKLTEGETVTAKNGTVIKPEMVVGLAPPRPAMIIIDCPSPEYIDSLISSNAFMPYQVNNKLRLHCVFHLLGPGVLEDQRYIQWLERFGKDVHHLYTGPTISRDRIRFISAAYAQLRLSHLDKDMFHVPICSPLPSPIDTTELPGKTTLLQHTHTISITPPTEPSLRSGEAETDLLHPALEKEGDKNVDAVLLPKTLQAYKDAWNAISKEESAKPRKKQPGDDLAVIPLGTSSAQSTKYRNVSGLLLQLPNVGPVLLDCGEGTYGQLRRQFGEECDDVLRSLRCIFISHMHADHHMGLGKVLLKRHKLNPTHPVYLISPQEAIRSLREYSWIEELGINDSDAVRFIYADNIRWGYRPDKNGRELIQEVGESRRVLKEAKFLLGLSDIYTVRAFHRGPYYGIVIKHPEGWSVVYSGDTRPNDVLAQAGKAATLLIHEATFADDQGEAAVAKRHSTLGEAIGIAKQMQAKNVLLTHFSNRYPKVMELTTGKKGREDPTIGVAFDHAVVKVGELWKLNRYLKAIEQSFGDSEDVDDIVGPEVME